MNNILQLTHSLRYMALAIIIMIFSSYSYADVGKAYQHLYEEMDRYHESFDVYTDMNEGGNHYYPTGWMASGPQDYTFLSMNESYTSDCYAGNSCIEVTYESKEKKWVSLYWQEPENNWGDIEDAGYDLSGASQLTFYAKGETGKEQIEFYMGGIGLGQNKKKYPDSLKKQSTGLIRLTQKWKQYSISLNNLDLSHVIGGFGFAIDSKQNPKGITLYIDHVQYNKPRPNELRFIKSFETLSVNQEPDKTLVNVCYSYDNALALLAFLARGNKQDLVRAKILADTFCYVLHNDREFNDGRIRNAYKSGDIQNRTSKKANLPGWYDPVDKQWYENNFDVSSHTGNIAWPILALISYYEKTKESKYLEAAEKMGEWIETKTRYSQQGCFEGYSLGMEFVEGEEKKLLNRSTEHNIDIYAVFIRLYQITGKEHYKEQALHAQKFVREMWNSEGHHFWTGTYGECRLINESAFPLDIHPWSVMAMPQIVEFRKGLEWAEKNCKTKSDGFVGFDFNNDLDGVWFEGTAQMAVAFQVNHEMEKSDLYAKSLQAAQVTANNNNGKGIVAASHDYVSTGFDWVYHNRLHIGATAWYIFNEMHYNPYFGVYIDQICPTNDPEIIFTDIPEFGNRLKDLKGKVCHADPANQKIAVYIYVSGYWNKPYWNQKVVDIKENGRFQCDITTGSYDYRATRITAFLIPDSYVPPKRSGENDLPEILYEKAITYKSVMRIGIPENECDPEKASIEFTFVPELESFNNLIGRVCNASYENHAVAVYIYVNGWWTKPTFRNPVTFIERDGFFECDITTGGYDIYASKIAAFLIPAGYNPPLLGNNRVLPPELYENAVDYIEINRPMNR